ncbi:MAG: hypothetical protein ACPGCL_04565 [Paracoccaceae bacterium]
MLGVERSIFNRSVIWLYIIKVIKITLTFIAVTFIFIRNFIDPQGLDGFHKFLALVFMELQDPIAIKALNPLLWLVWFAKSVFFIWLGHRISLCLPAAAIGKDISLRESWRKTSELKGQILLLAGVEVLVYFGISAADSWVSALIGAVVSAMILGLLQT